MARCSTCHRRLGAGRPCPEHGGPPAEVPPAIEPGPAPAWSAPLGACIGSGGFAAVWEIAGTDRVLKVAHASHDLARARMRREAEALAEIGPPAVPRSEGTGVLPDGRAWVAMERIAGKSLADLLAAGPMPLHRASAIAAGILDALVLVHTAGFVHRDLKPDNLVRRPDGSIAILDLGLARRLPADPDDPTRAGVQVGSLEYMPPEQLIAAETVDVRADLYAFGCVLYELCAGRPPFVGDAATLERAHGALRPPPLGALAKVPQALEALCHECLAKQPSRRPASAAVVAERLRAVRGEANLERPQQHSRSVIGEGKQPVVLLWAELPRVDRTLLGMLAARKVTVASQRGRRVLGGIVGAEHADPAAAGIAVARDLAAAGARVALHLDSVRVATGPQGTILVGPSVERPETWLPEGPWTGVVLTSSLAGVSRTRTRPTNIGTGFLRLGEAGEPTELFGRDPVLAEITADAAAALGGAGPGLALLVGEPGVGKTEVVTALLPRLRELGARVHAGTIPPPGAGRPAHTALGELVARTVDGPVVRVVGDALRAAARSGPVAVLLDELHLAPHELLDALEYATLGGEPLPLWILGVATPRLELRRPGFGARAERHRRLVLAPLDEDAAVAMTAALLRPAEYPPLRALRQIAAIARGNPMHLVTLAREIHDRGAIRTRPTGEHFLDTTALEALPPIALGPWLAARELANLSPELVALARLCAVLGDDLAQGELAAVVDQVERQGGATTTIDVDVGLAELEHAGILVQEGDHWRFRQTLLEEGVYTTTNEDERRVLHAAALDYWRLRDDPARLARHAEAVGERATAAAAYAVLGARAHAEHRELDADQAWEGALRNLDAGDPAIARALLGRGRARYRMQRRNEALGDLARVIELADAAGDAPLAVEALLEQATVHDWVGDFERSQASGALAAERLAAIADAPARLGLGVALAQARSLYRFQRFDRATPALRRVAETARSSELPELEVVARMLLGASLVDTAELDEAESEFARLVPLCEQLGDLFHLAATYVNRARVWSARGLVERSADDMRRVIQLSREGGQAQIERAATYNMAEDLLWQGQLDEALQLAQRSLALQLGQGEGSAVVDRVLVARVLAARGDVAALGVALEELRTQDALSDELAAEMQGQEHAVLGALEAVLDPSPRWEAVLVGARSLPASLQIEIGLLAAAVGGLDDEMRARIRELAQADPVFAGRLREL